jgi:tetratricopeptide (TPR) repeat protein
MSMKARARRLLLPLAIGCIALAVVGCGDEQEQATQKLVQQQQDQLERQQQEIEAIKANQNQNQNQNQNYTPGVAMSSSPGGCDKGVESMASQRGGEKFSAGDFNAALGYYQDALAACPNDDRADVNVARAYEALGNKVSAIKYYRKAADTGGPTETDAEDEARASLLRLQADRLP